MAKHPWRMQAEIPYGETDFDVTVFMGDAVAELDEFDDPTGRTIVVQDVRNPVVMKYSELASVLDLADVTKIQDARDTQVAERKSLKPVLVSEVEKK